MKNSMKNSWNLKLSGAAHRRENVIWIVWKIRLIVVGCEHLAQPVHTRRRQPGVHVQWFDEIILVVRS